MGRSAAGDDRAIGARIRAARVSSGMSQGALAQMVGVTYQQMHKYECGRSRVSAARLVKIAGCVGVPVGVLVEGEVDFAPARRGVLELARMAWGLSADDLSALTHLAARLAVRHD